MRSAVKMKAAVVLDGTTTPQSTEAQAQISSSSAKNSVKFKVQVKQQSQKPSTSVSTALPIDQYRSQILEKIQRDRVVFIHGETGCGKSSRLPVMIYEDAIARRKVWNISHQLSCKSWSS